MQIIFERDDGWYMTSKRNYDSYVWDSFKIKKLQDVNTIDDVYEFIDKACKWFGGKPENYIIIRR